MKGKLLMGSVFLIVFLTLCRPVLAHHGSAAYSDQMTTVKQVTVTKFQWSNPHSIIMFDAKDDKGNVVHWAAEAGSPSALSLIGWSKGSLHAGDVATVYIFQSKAGTPVGRLNRIVLPDGTTLRDSMLGGDAYKGSGTDSSK